MLILTYSMGFKREEKRLPAFVFLSYKKIMIQLG